jgi:DNA repair/transcription protein MET18/MMS19
MESDLNSSDPYKRAQAVQNLSNVMTLDTLEKANAYLDFFLQRLNDQLSVGGALNGILRIVQKVEIQNLEKIAQTIVQELNFSSLPQSDRFKILQIYSFSLCRSKISRDYVEGFLHLVNGEKDPRCLLLALKIIKGIMQNFDCRGLEEDIFDWTFAYFPITFKEKATDPSIVTQSDLRNALKDCITVDLVGMGQFVIPFLMEKMESSLGLAKRDAMIFLGYASRIYHQDLFNKILPKLWVWLKEEVSLET